MIENISAQNRSRGKKVKLATNYKTHTIISRDKILQ